MSQEDQATPPPSPEPPESVWSYRGYKIRPGEFNTAMVHLYRGEVTRSNTWRTRLDSTTNWAVVTVGAVLTFAFGSVNNSHVVILISFLLVWLFLVIESRRYRYYELWALRVRLMESDFLAAMFSPPFAPHREWASRLADSLRTPTFPITFWEAIGRRMRRNYIWLFTILGVAWTMKLLLHPIPARSLRAFINHAGIGFISGELVVTVMLGFYLVVILVAVLTIRMRQSAGEILPHLEALGLPGHLIENLANAASAVLPGDIPLLHRHEQLVIIITDQAEAVSQELLNLLKRGVTALQGKGMYSGTPRSVLLCAIIPSEVERLKNTVYAVDQDAFVVVNPTEEILGSGFGALEPRWKRTPKPKK